MLHLLELLGDVALAVDERLLADVGVGHLVVIGLGDLDVIAEDLVVADLERLDAGPLLLAGLQLGQDAAGVGEQGAQVVHLAAVARADDAALAHGERRLVDDAAGDQVAQLRQTVQVPAQPGQQDGRLVGQLDLQGGQAAQAGRQGDEVTAPGGAVDDAGDEPFQVRDLLERLDDLAAGDGPIDEPGHGVEPPPDGDGVEQRPLQPAAHETAAHGGAGVVEDPQERAALFLAVQGRGQLQVAAGRRVEGQKALGRVPPQGVHIGEIRLLGLVEVGHETARRADGRLGVLVRRAGRELRLHDGAGGIEGEARLGGLLDAAALPPGEIVEDGAALRAGREQDLPRGHAGQLAHGAVLPVGPGEGGDEDLAGGDVAEGEPGTLRPGPERGEEVVLAVLEHVALDQRAGGDDADDLPIDQPLGLGGVLGLFADGDLVALGDQPRDVRLGGVVRHAAHGGTLGLGLVPVAGGQGQAQLLRGELGVLVEHLIEVAEAEEEEAIGVLGLDRQILLFHRGQLGHGTPSPPSCL